MGIGPFVKQHAGAFAERLGEEGKRPAEGGDGAGDDDVGGVGVEVGFSAFRQGVDVVQAEGVDCGDEERGLLQSGLEEGEAGVRHDQGKRDAGETGAGAGIGNVLRAGEEPPGENGVEDMLDGGLAGVEDAGEVEVLVGLDDECEMAGGAGDTGVAMGQIGGQ